MKHSLCVTCAWMSLTGLCVAEPRSLPLAVDWQFAVTGEGESAATNLCETSDGGVVVVGFREHAPDDPDVFAVRLTGQGAPVWQTTIENVGFDRLDGVAELADGSLVAVGAFQPAGGKPSLPTLFAWTGDGKLGWSRAVDESQEGWLRDVVVTQEGDIVSVGSLGSFATAIPRLYLVKTTAAGAILWQKTPAAPQVLEGVRVRRLDDGFLIAGRSLVGAITTLRWLLAVGPRPACADALDANDDAAVDLSDAIYLLVVQFQGGDAPPSPFGAPGVDPTPELMGCGSTGASS